MAFTKQIGPRGSFVMKQLEKPEYFLMRKLVEDFKLKDPSELFAASCVLLFEVLHRSDLQGHDWIVRIINDLRTLKVDDRRY